jgi:hypothetical protein
MLIYVGKGAFVVGIPGRDLTAEEVDMLGGAALIMHRAPGLYAAPPKPKAKPAPKPRAEHNPKEG